MAAFERVKSGIPEMDGRLDHIRLGDNVVWRVSGLEEFHLLLEHDTEAERRFADRGQNRVIRFISCAGLVRRKDIMEDMRRMLRLIQREYGCPVDTEFTINLSERPWLLFCRKPLDFFFIRV